MNKVNTIKPHIYGRSYLVGAPKLLDKINIGPARV